MPSTAAKKAVHAVLAIAAQAVFATRVSLQKKKNSALSIAVKAQVIVPWASYVPFYSILDWEYAKADLQDSSAMTTMIATSSAIAVTRQRMESAPVNLVHHDEECSP
jgi:hypothetical protein